MPKTDIDPKQLVIDKIMARGGWVNAHAHIDRAFILNNDNFRLVNATLKEKWDFPDNYKRAASVDDIYGNMTAVVDDMIEQGVQAIGSFIDVDPVIEDKAIQAARKLRENYKDKIQIKFINQVVKGVLEPEARKWFEIGAEFADIVGGLPEKDIGREAEHLDVLFEAAKKNGGKMLHVHVDQFNLPNQRDTELLVDKTIQHGHEGKVVAVHCISVGAQPKGYRRDLYRKMRDAGVMVVACPCGWIDNSWVAGQSEDIIGPIHNSVTPVKEMVEAGLTVALGTDNIQDIYKPFSDGAMWTELRFLLETNRFYEMDALAEIASTNGLRSLGIENMVSYDQMEPVAQHPVFNPYKTLGDNLRAEPEVHEFLGFKVNSLFGMAACPAAASSAYIRAAFSNGFDVVTSKTQRSVRFPANIFPNVLQLDLDGHLTPERTAEPITGYLPESIDPTNFTIANSCGNPSEGPQTWMDDMRKSLAAVGDGQLLIASVVGTIKDGFGASEYHDDFAQTADLAAQTGVKVIELNLSCPNVASEGIICYSPEAVEDIARRVREKVGKNIKLLGKMGYFLPRQEDLLHEVVQRAVPYLDGFVAINTIAAPIVDRNGNPAFHGPGREKAGVSGSSIKWAGVEMVNRLNNIRNVHGLNFAIVGIGGVMKPQDYVDYKNVGADLVQSATGAMWNPELAHQIKNHLKTPYVVKV